MESIEEGYGDVQVKGNKVKFEQEVTTESLLESWRKTVIHRTRKALAQMTYPRESYEKNYGADSRKKIAFAIAFWAFVKNHVNNCSREVRLDFLKKFVKSENQPAAIVAKLECLPTSVWIRLLWEVNINFNGMEAFLRRLWKVEPEKISKIEQCYDEYMSGDVPSVVGRLKKFFRIVTMKKLKNEELNPELRYETKGSWSHNIMRLGIGFHAYPGGENDDTHVVGKDFRRIFAWKNHIADFCVNKKYGRYNNMYISCRSSAGYRPNRKVEMKKNFCPGMWYTFIMQFCFWILSPVAFVAASYMWQISGGWLWFFAKIAVSIPAALMPLWLLSAAVYKSLRFLARMAPELAKRMEKWVDDHEKGLEMTGKIVFNSVKVIFYGAIYVFIAAAILLIHLFVMQPWLGILAAMAFDVAVGGYFIYLFYHRHKYNYSCSINNHPRQLRWLYKAALFFIAVMAGWKHSDVVLAFAFAAYQVLSYAAPFSLIFLIPALAIYFSERLGKKYEAEKDWERFEKLAMRAMKLFLGAFWVILTGMMYFIFTLPHSSVTAMNVLTFVVIVIFYLVALGMTFWYVHSNNYVTMISDQTVRKYPFKEESKMPRGKMLFDLVRKNKYLSGLSIPERIRCLDAACDFIDSNFREKEQGLAFRTLLSVIDEGIVEKFHNLYEQAEEDLRKIGMYAGEINYENKYSVSYRLLKMLAKGMFYKEALALIIAEEYQRQYKERKRIEAYGEKDSARRRRRRARQKIYAKIWAGPEAVIQFVVDFKRLVYDVLEHSCPHIEESQFIDTSKYE